MSSRRLTAIDIDTERGPDSGIVGDPPTGRTRSDRKRAAIVDVGARLFLRQGYQGTTMDEIAAAAGVSKQTVYKQFHDKEQLFSAIVLGVTDRARSTVEMLRKLFDEIEDVENGLTRLANSYALAVISPQVISLRRLVIGEADRFPELAASYFDRAPRQGIEAISAGFDLLVARKLLQIEDTGAAAEQFAYLVLGPLIDRALFHPGSPVGEAEIRRVASSGVHAFVAAYA
jgi:TetR/AcrR family transcriptional regulator, mexJK operon transcriptional repressor